MNAAPATVAIPEVLAQTLKPESKPDPVDIHVGQRMRMRRTLVGMSQEKLGDAIGLTFQQIQKYERGTNRMGASRLYQMSQVLGVPVSYFFDDLPRDLMDKGFKGMGLAESGQHALDGTPSEGEDPLHRRETLELVRAYYRISDPKQRRKVFELVKSLGSTEESA